MRHRVPALLEIGWSKMLLERQSPTTSGGFDCRLICLVTSQINAVSWVRHLSIDEREQQRITVVKRGVDGLLVITREDEIKERAEVDADRILLAIRISF